MKKKQKKNVAVSCFRTLTILSVLIEANEADSHFKVLTSLLQKLGLPLNWNKYTPPARQLMCLGIIISIPEFTLSIDHDKLELDQGILHNLQQNYRWDWYLFISLIWTFKFNFRWQCCICTTASIIVGED